MDWRLIRSAILDFFYPVHCPYCKTLILTDEILCLLCYEKIKPLATLMLPLSGKKVLTVHAATGYTRGARTLVLKKFSLDTLASKQLAKLMLKFIDFNAIDADVIVPVPLHWTRYAKRGFNQANIIAQALSKALNIPVKKLLYRKKKTLFQSQLNKVNRVKNISQAFAINDWFGLRTLKEIEGKKILIIDDLCTTGITLQEAGKILLQLNPLSVSAAVACRAL